MSRLTSVSAAVLCIAVAACTKSQPRAVDSHAVETHSNADISRVVTPDGYGVVRVGISAAELATAIGTKIPPSRTPDDRSCRYVLLAALPSGMRVMLVNDSVARIDVAAPGPRTAAGAGIGDSEAHVVELYGDRATVRPNKYTGPVGHDVVVNAPNDSTHRLVFETNGKKVLRFRAGRQPAVDFVEGCG